MLSDLADSVIGVDPDRDRITLAIVDARSHAVLATTTLPTTPRVAFSPKGSSNSASSSKA